MARICGSVRWASPTPSRAEPRWASMRTLLGSQAVDCSPTPAGRVGLAVCSPEGSPPTPGQVARTADVAVVFGGYLRDVPPPHRGEAEYVLARYEAGDWSWLRAANGVFGFAVVDQTRDRCFLGVDRFGIRPLMFVQDDTGVAFAEDLAVLVPWRASPPEMDYDALQESVVLGFPLGERTLLRGVQRMPPGTWGEFGPGVRRVTRYWSLDELPSSRPGDPGAFLDESQERLRYALERLLSRHSGEALCLLSSGFDSRRLLLEAHAIGARLTTATAAWPFERQARTTIDPAVVGELCGRLGVPNHLVMPLWGGDALGPRTRRDVRNTLLDFQVYSRFHVWAIPLVASLPPSDRLMNLDGMAGDAWFTKPFYLLPRPIWGRSQATREVLDAMAPQREDADRAWSGLVSSSLASRLQAALNAIPEGCNRLTLFYLLGRTRRMVALLPYGLLNLRVESFCPYLDNDVVEHAFTLDPFLKGELRVQEVALRRHYPAFADIPSSHSRPSEVPASYRLETSFPDPAFVGRFTRAEMALLFRAVGLRHRYPRAGWTDLAFACLSAAGLGRLGGSWREPGIRDLLQAFRAIDTLTAGRSRTPDYCPRRGHRGPGSRRGGARRGRRADLLPAGSFGAWRRDWPPPQVTESCASSASARARQNVISMAPNSSLAAMRACRASSSFPS